LEKLLGYLEVEPVDKYLFIGKSPKRPARIFGGQVLAQSLSSAFSTVDSDRIAHSMHGYFLRPGDPAKQIVYEVDPIRDGRSFTTRRVVAKQDGRAIFSTAVSFQVAEEGLSHQSSMPDVPQPEELESEQEQLAELAKTNPELAQMAMLGPIERRRVNPRDRINPQPQEAIEHMWFKVESEIGGDYRRHQMLLAYISDFGLLGTALYPHPYSPQSKEIQAASLDHALWFHRPFRLDNYLLYSLDSPSLESSRGFSRGSFYTRNGVLVASSAQESLLRLRTD
jgi:acyl-CoA thioesterase-2